MFALGVLFLIIALVAYLLGEERVGSFAIQAAKIILIIALVLFLFGLLFGGGGLWWPIGPAGRW